LVLAAVRRSGVPMQRIRPALRQLQEGLGVEHALASQKLYTDGAELLFDYGEQHAADEEGRLAQNLVVVRNGQRVFTEVIEAYLRRIEYGADGYASLIRLPAYERAQVVVDPTRAFGVPIFERGGVRVDDVLERFWAGEPVCSTTGCTVGWAQAGWSYYSSGAPPAGYCEFNGPGFYQQTGHAISQVAHTYRMDRSSASPGYNWTCKIDGVSKATAHSSSVGFSTAPKVIVQGEAHDTHVQIGLMAPGKLVASSLAYLNSSGTAIAMSPTLNTPNAPYGIDKPTTTQVRMWTNGH
jgi:hypothetical protein